MLRFYGLWKHLRDESAEEEVHCSTRLCGLKLRLHTSHTITSATVITYFTLCYQRNGTHNDRPLLLLIKVLLIISLPGLFHSGVYNQQMHEV